MEFTDERIARTQPDKLIYGNTFAYQVKMEKTNREGEEINDWFLLDNDSWYDTSDGNGILKIAARRRLPSEEAPYYDWAIGN